MPSKSPLHRIQFILSKLKPGKTVSFAELVDAYKREMEPKFLDGVLATDTFTQRTFQRDIRFLQEIYQMEIVFDKKAKGYRLADNAQQSRLLRTMLDTLSLHKLVQMKPAAAQVIFPDERKADGQEWMFLLLHAITSHHKVELTYQKFDGDPSFTKILNPLGLKEFRNRWYLLAFHDGKPEVRTYGLDRISGPKIIDRKFDPSEAEDWQPKFECVFGITSGNPEETEDIVLSFKPQQGKYVQALKLHSSQATILEDEKEIRIGLRLYLTHDFLMELLSYGPEVEVLEPKSLREELADMHEKAFRLYVE